MCRVDKNTKDIESASILVPVACHGLRVAVASQDDLAEEFIQLVPEDAEFEVRAKELDVLTVLIVELFKDEV